MSLLYPGLLNKIEEKLKQPYNSINFELSGFLSFGLNYYIDKYLKSNLIINDVYEFDPSCMNFYKKSMVNFFYSNPVKINFFVKRLPIDIFLTNFGTDNLNYLKCVIKNDLNHKFNRFLNEIIQYFKDFKLFRYFAKHFFNNDLRTHFIRNDRDFKILKYEIKYGAIIKHYHSQDPKIHYYILKRLNLKPKDVPNLIYHAPSKKSVDYLLKIGKGECSIDFDQVLNKNFGLNDEKVRCWKSIHPIQKMLKYLNVEQNATYKLLMKAIEHHDMYTINYMIEKFDFSQINEDDKCKIFKYACSSCNLHMITALYESLNINFYFTSNFHETILKEFEKNKHNKDGEFSNWFQNI